MDYSVEFYESASGQSPVREFLLELKASDPGDFAAVAAGLEKLRHGIRNKGQAIPARDLDTARARMQDWKERNEL